MIPHKLFFFCKNSSVLSLSLSLSLSLQSGSFKVSVYSLNKMDSTDRTQDICGNFASESISERKKTGFSDGLHQLIPTSHA